MIISFLLYILAGFVGGLIFPLTKLPDVVLDPNIAAAVGNAGQYLNMADVFLPIATLMAIFGLFLTIEAAILTYKVFMWVKELVW